MNKDFGKRIFKTIGKFFLCVFTCVLSLVVALLLIINVFCNGGSESAKKMFVSTILETGALKFLASLYISPEEIQMIVDGNSMSAIDSTVNENLITVVAANEDLGRELVLNEDEVPAGAVTTSYITELGSTESAGSYLEEDEDGDGIIIHEIAGRTFYATLMIVLDPSRVTLGSYYYDIEKKNKTLKEITEAYYGIGGINAGLYYNGSDAGGRPYGVCVAHGKIQLNKPQESKGLVLIGLTEDNILITEDVSQMTSDDVVKLVEEKKIRDACCFQEESSDKNNHFVYLIVNGEKRELNGGMGSGLNPRTAIGQRADGALLLLCTDGRGYRGHLGASASDLMDIMAEYGAVNAANLDGGSSTSMYFNGEYIMETVTFRKPNSSWNMPYAFVIK